MRKVAIAGIVTSLWGAVAAVNLSIHAGMAYHVRQVLEADQCEIPEPAEP